MSRAAGRDHDDAALDPGEGVAHPVIQRNDDDRVLLDPAGPSFCLDTG